MSTTLSFYSPGDSSLHHLNPLTKVTACLTLVFLAFVMPWPLLPPAEFLLIIIPAAVTAGVTRRLFRSLSILFLPFAGFLVTIHTLCTPGGEPLFASEWVTISEEGLRFALHTAGRVLVMLSGFTLLFLCTHPGRLMDDLVHRGLPPSVGAVTAMTLQLLPMLGKRAKEIIAAQQARGMDTGTTFVGRIKGVLPLAAPLIISAFTDAEQRTMALEARGFFCPGPRTRLTTIPDTAAERFFRAFCLGLILVTTGVRIWIWYNSTM